MARHYVPDPVATVLAILEGWDALNTDGGKPLFNDPNELKAVKLRKTSDNPGDQILVYEVNRGWTRRFMDWASNKYFERKDLLSIDMRTRVSRDHFEAMNAEVERLILANANQPATKPTGAVGYDVMEFADGGVDFSSGMSKKWRRVRGVRLTTYVESGPT